MTKAPINVYKAEKFDAFLKIIDEGVVAHWQDIANALEINKDTITAWKKTPEAKKAIMDGIVRGLQCMEQAGRKDWKMWEAKLRMLGVNPATKVEVSNPIGDILTKYGLENGGKDVGQVKKT